MISDTHTLIWALDDPSKLSGPAWELAIKISTGKLALSLPYRQWMERAILDLGLTVLPVTIAYAERQMALPPHHKDPFDRMIIAQALVDGVQVISVDAAFDAYGVARLW